MSDDDDRVGSIAAALREYVQRHPNAADSMQGIQRWWLTGPQSECPALMVQQALDRLIGEGVVERRRLPDGQALYAATRRQSTG